MERKILQIILAPDKLVYGYPEENGLYRPVCLALVEQEDGHREVKVMEVIQQTQYIDFLEDDAVLAMEK